MSDLKHLPKGYQLPENNFSKEEWREYFQYRKERDIEMSRDEIEFWLELMEQEFKKGNLKRAKEILHKIPYNPDFALGIKKTQGLGTLATCNLSLAKQVYLDVF